MPSVHFISHDDLESAVTRYRCVNIAEALRAEGWEVQCSWEDDKTFSQISADVVVLHRMLWSDELAELIAQLKAAGKAVVYGVDDLIFTLEWCIKESSEYGHTEGWEDLGDRKGHLKDAFRVQSLTLRALLQSDAVLVSTELIADRVIQLGKDAFVIRNTLSEKQIKLSDEAHRNIVKRPDNVVIGYLSGSRTHNSDFARIEPAITTLLNKNPELSLQIVGPLCLSPSLESYAGRIHILPMVPWSVLPTAIGSLDVNLSVLDTSQMFNLGKSHIRWLEAAAVGIPTVASRTPEFARSIENGKTGFLVSSTLEWEECLQKLVSDPGLRNEVGEAARKASIQHHAVNNSKEIALVFSQMLTKFGRSKDGSTVAFIRKLEEPPPPPPRKPLINRLVLYPFKWLGSLYRAVRSAFIGQYPF